MTEQRELEILAMCNGHRIVGYAEAAVYTKATDRPHIDRLERDGMIRFLSARPCMTDIGPGNDYLYEVTTKGWLALEEATRP